MLSFVQLQSLFEKNFQHEIGSIQSTEPALLYEPVAYSLEGGGKRIRPVLLLHAASLFTDQPLQYFPAAAAIELFHNFTLLHDDIMDHALIRRGVDAVHVKYGENSAILSGDAMSILSFKYLAACKTGKLQELLELFSVTALEVCEGQQFDMEFETREVVTIPEYLEMIRLKTAVLIACSLKAGAILAGADETNCLQLYEFGIKTGIAFQLQDDWLDVYGDEKSFGKKIGGDILENKKTFLMLKALEMGNVVQVNDLNNWIAATNFQPEEKIVAVREIFTSSGAADAARSLMTIYHDQAILALEQLAIPNSEKSELLNFAGSVLARIR